jgi:Transcriptional regulator, AbiEi antitoxin
MNARACGVMAANHGLITRAQALDCGLAAGEIRRCLRSGELVLVGRGVYCNGAVWASLDDHVGRPKLRTRAAIRTMTRGWVVSHDSAAHEHGLPILTPPDPHVHVTRPGTTGAWTKNGVKHHLARFSEDQVVQLGDLKVLDLARTAVDIARELGSPYGEIACDAALRRGVPRSALEAAVAPMTNWPHVRRTREAVAFADRRAASLVETMGRLLVTALQLGPIDLQFPARLENGHVVWGDIRVGCHFFECDGKGKYLPLAEGGFAEKPITEVVWDEKKRERLLHRVGLGTSRIFFEDYWSPQREIALVRMKEEYEETVARFGDRLPDHLMRNAREIREQEGRRAG